MSVIVIGITFVIVSGLLWVIFTSIKQNSLPNRTDYTPYDDMMSGRVDRDPLQSFMNQNDNERETK